MDAIDKYKSMEAINASQAPRKWKGPLPTPPKRTTLTETAECLTT